MFIAFGLHENGAAAQRVRSFTASWVGPVTNGRRKVAFRVRTVVDYILAGQYGGLISLLQ